MNDKYTVAKSMRVDVVIIGGGVAGLAAALSIAPSLKVAILTKLSLLDCASNLAQGGVAAALDSRDSILAHINDTVTAGHDLCRMEAVESIIGESTAAILWLEEQGVQFDKQNGNFILAREGGHSARRIAHIGDMTGHKILAALQARVARRSNIHIIENAIAINLYISEKRCRGVYVLSLEDNKIFSINARATLLATGGAGKVYLYTTTPPNATGDGVAMAYRAGCRIANMEFVQFHPTCLYHPMESSFLITEAMRGEGARLTNDADEQFMQGDISELSSRDIVARAIDVEMKRTGADCVYLDLSSRPLAFWRRRFPTIVKRCEQLGIDIRRGIPVVPAAHYCCGGVVTDICGRTDVLGLYAAGEVACNGLHGANRLASNSLLECVVVGRWSAATLAEELPASRGGDIPLWNEQRVSKPIEKIMIAHNWEELRRLMWNYVGIVRSDERLAQARWRIENINEEIDQYYQRYIVSRDFLELRNLLQCARLIIEGALSRRESRGLHYNRDCPQPSENAIDTVLQCEDFERRARAINAYCPFSGRPIVANGLTDYGAVIIGFCNPQCRDIFCEAVAYDFANANDSMLSARDKINRWIAKQSG